jgi:hypothetical protein
MSRAALRTAAETFCQTLPHTEAPYSSRAWGHNLHSLCSYQGKLKPAIAAHLVANFTSPGDLILDPLSGAGTIPLEAHLQGRIALGNDLQELAYALTAAKVSSLRQSEVFASIGDLEVTIRERTFDPSADVSFGFNGPVSEYFHADTLGELVSARSWVRRTLAAGPSPADAFVIACLMHVLHGNRPYALSRTSHPVTPFRPTGDAEYKSVVEHVTKKAVRALAAPKLPGVLDGQATLGDYRNLVLEKPVDAVITSPPFAESTRFYIANWMRLWMSGWDEDDFKLRADAFLERQQKKSFDVYREFFAACHGWLKPGGTVILHLGRTAKVSMSEQLTPMAKEAFDVVYAGEECVGGREKFGIRDQGATKVHEYLFLSAR